MSLLPILLSMTRALMRARRGSPGKQGSMTSPEDFIEGDKDKWGSMGKTS